LPSHRIDFVMSILPMEILIIDRVGR